MVCLRRILHRVELAGQQAWAVSRAVQEEMHLTVATVSQVLLVRSVNVVFRVRPSAHQALESDSTISL